jgi:hypothetical protein
VKTTDYAPQKNEGEGVRGINNPIKQHLFCKFAHPLCGGDRRLNLRKNNNLIIRQTTYRPQLFALTNKKAAHPLKESGFR